MFSLEGKTRSPPAAPPISSHYSKPLLTIQDGHDTAGRRRNTRTAFSLPLHRTCAAVCMMVVALFWVVHLLLSISSCSADNMSPPPPPSSPSSSSTTSSSLGDLALQRVLDDASQIFGPYDPTSKPTSPASRTEWMKSIPDSTPLTHLSIPGTHDSSTWNFTQETRNRFPHNNDPGNFVLDADVYRCQSASMADALDAGVRFFDLRYALAPVVGGLSKDGEGRNGDEKLVFWHNRALLSVRATVEDVMFGFYAWLERHPSEVLFLSFQYEVSLTLLSFLLCFFLFLLCPPLPYVLWPFGSWVELFVHQPTCSSTEEHAPG